MPISEITFDSENELQTWVFDNIHSFLPGTILTPGYRITTPSGKAGIPDGFAFDFNNREWYVIECELLNHGVWPHIAEQITRFIVALQNPETTRTIRDQIFEYLLEHDLVSEIVDSLNTKRESLMKQIELFVEGVTPELVIFIDETNQDLTDMAGALDIPTRIFRVNKLLVDDTIEYYSPDIHAPVLSSVPSEESSLTEYDELEALGDATLEASARRFKCYRLSDDTIIHLKRSKFYPQYDSYWYGISVTSLSYFEEFNVSHIAFIMGEIGFVLVPMPIIEQFLGHTYTSKNPDGSIRHYHVYISNAPEPELYSASGQPRIPLSDYFHPLEL